MKCISLFLKIWSCISVLVISNSAYAAWVSTSTTHFKIEYENDLAKPDYATPEYITKVKTIAEEVWSYVITNQGFQRPPNVPENPANENEKVRIEVKNISDYGEISIDRETPTYRPLITIDNDYSAAQYPRWNGLNALRTTLIHEFFHAVQQSYAHKDAYNSETLDWFWEGTAA